MKRYKMKVGVISHLINLLEVFQMIKLIALTNSKEILKKLLTDKVVVRDFRAKRVDLKGSLVIYKTKRDFYRIYDVDTEELKKEFYIEELKAMGYTEKELLVFNLSVRKMNISNMLEHSDYVEPSDDNPMWDEN